ncbi:MAG: hypothetical protein GC181_13385 [Bacteroidetes bacterium]|nr:hypothetical protein [Bacteroidota bacterium]
MIKIFRTIRQKLISENRLSKYLFYFTGEIVLVVIGILIALQINDWNLHRIDRVAEKKLLQNILQDLHKDTEVFDINIQNNMFQIAVLDTMLHEVCFNPEGYSPMDFIRHNALYSYYGSFLATKGSYVESLSSGRLSLILSDSLRRSILDYYEVQLQSLGADIIINHDMDNLRAEWNDIVSHSMEYAMVLDVQTNFPQWNIPEICGSPRYRKLLTQKLGLVRVQIEHWERVKAVNEQLIKFINSELKLK